MTTTVETPPSHRAIRPPHRGTPDGGASATGSPPTGRARQTRRNIGWNFASGMLSVVGLLVLYPLAVRGAGSSAYGLWVVCFAMVQLLITTDLGIGTGIVRSIAIARVDDDEEEVRRVVSLGLTMFGGLSIVLGAVMAVVLPIYLHSLHLAPKVAHEELTLTIVSVATLVTGLFGRGATAVLWGDNRYDIERKGQLIGLVVRAVGIVACAAIHSGVVPVALLEAFSMFLPGAVASVVALRWHHPRIVGLGTLRTEGAALLKFSMKVFVGALAALAAIQTPLYITASYLPLVAVTALGAWLRLFQGGRMILSWLANPFLATTAADSTQARARLAATHRKLLSVSLALACAMAAPLLAAPRALSAAWLGPEFGFAGDTFRWIGLCVIAMAISVPGSVLASAGGRPGGIAIVNVVWWLATTIALVASSSSHSLMVAVVCITVPLVALTPFYLRESVRVTGFRPARADLARACTLLGALCLGSCALLAVVGHHLDRAHVALGLAAYGAVTGLVLAVRFQGRARQVIIVRRMAAA